MPVPKELREKLLKKEEIVGISDPEGELRVYVETEEDAKKLLLEMKEIKIAGVSYKVKPIVVGRITALQLLKPLTRTEKVRPIPGGVSIGNFAITAGSSGFIAIDKETREKVLVSNAHVLVDLIYGRETRISQPGPYDLGFDAEKIIENYVGDLVKYAEIKWPPATNLVDAAVMKPLSPDLITEEIVGIGKPNGFAEVSEGQAVKKSGRTTGLTVSRVFDTRATIKVWYDENYAIFEDIIIVKPAFARGGDSGSACLDEANRIVGLVFAGSDEVTAICKIKHVLELLNLEGEVQPAYRPSPLPAIILASLPLIAFIWPKE